MISSVQLTGYLCWVSRLPLWSLLYTELQIKNVNKGIYTTLSVKIDLMTHYWIQNCIICGTAWSSALISTTTQHVVDRFAEVKPFSLTYNYLLFPNCWKYCFRFHSIFKCLPQPFDIVTDIKIYCLHGGRYIFFFFCYQGLSCYGSCRTFLHSAKTIKEDHIHCLSLWIW